MPLVSLGLSCCIWIGGIITSTSSGCRKFKPNNICNNALGSCEMLCKRKLPLLDWTRYHNFTWFNLRKIRPQALRLTILPSSLHLPSSTRKALEGRRSKGQPCVMERVSKSGSHCLAVGPGTASSPSLVQSPDPESRLFWMRLTKVPTPPHESKSPGKPLQNANTQTSCRDSFLIGLSINTFEILTRWSLWGAGSKRSPLTGWSKDRLTAHNDWMSEEACEPTWGSRTEGDEGVGVAQKGSEASSDIGGGAAEPQFHTPCCVKEAWAPQGPSWKAFHLEKDFLKVSTHLLCWSGELKLFILISKVLLQPLEMRLCSCFPLQTVSRDGDRGGGEVTRELSFDAISGLVGGLRRCESGWGCKGTKPYT